MVQSRSTLQASPAADSARALPATGIAAHSIYAEIVMRVFSVISLVGCDVATFMGLEALWKSRWISSILTFCIAAGVAILGLNVLSVIATILLIALCMISGTPTLTVMMLLSATPFVFAVMGARRSILT